MSAKYLSLVSAFFPVFGLLCSGPGSADTPAPPEPYAVEAGDYVFVMQGDDSEHDKDRYFKQRENFYNTNCEAKIQKGDVKKRCNEIAAIKRYRRSGLYRKGGSNRPLWTVDWYAGGVAVSSDGLHLVRMGPWADSVDDEAISFFERGQLLAKYTISDLVDDYGPLVYTTSHFRWKSNDFFDDLKSTYSLSTLDKNDYQFDIRTGRISKFIHHPAQVYQADFLLKGGRRKHLDDVRSCSSLKNVNGFRGGGFHRHAIVALDHIKITRRGDESYNMVPIMYEAIKHVKLIKRIKKRRFLWDLELQNGNSGEITIQGGYVGFCGAGAGGLPELVIPGDIAELTLSRGKAVPSGHIRSARQRMHGISSSGKKIAGE